ncbi:helix-turn-helix domain-containing protein [Mycobacteroides abscessus]|uniref:helix-turn-helix domain-containing protein n=1 Tax=Mycobacteroides abscessus TaxID=36809 RepID=UPI0009424296
MDERPLAFDSDSAARMLGVSRRTLERERSAGRICCRYLGSKPLYPFEELKAWLDSLPSEPPTSL